MFELWAKKRPINGTGFQYEKICTFDRVEMIDYMVDQLDENIYQEALVMDSDKRCYVYREYEKPLLLKRIIGGINDKD